MAAAPPDQLAPGGAVSRRSADFFCEAIDSDRVDMLESEPSHGVEDQGEVAGGGEEGGEDVQGGHEVFVEKLGVAGETAVQEDGVTLRV